MSTSTLSATTPPFPLPASAHPHPKFNHQFQYISIYIASQTEPSIVFVALDRPRKRNAINAKMWREINQVFTTLGTTGDDDTRCIILLGIGKAFCSGIDITDPSFGFMPTTSSPNDDDDDNDTAAPPDVARKAIAFYPKILQMQQAFTALEKCPVPIVAAIHGSCIGAGVDLACCTDIRYCVAASSSGNNNNNSSTLSDESTTFSVREVKLGLAADIGTLQRLPKLCGYNSQIKELCFTGQNFDGIKAQDVGFVSCTEPTMQQLVQKAMEIALEIASQSPVAVVGTKQSLIYSRDHSVEEGLENVALFNSAALMTDDLMTSFLKSGRKKTGGGDEDEEDVRFPPLLPRSRL